jgi:hypothetical protein
MVNNKNGSVVNMLAIGTVTMETSNRKLKKKVLIACSSFFNIFGSLLNEIEANQIFPHRFACFLPIRVND